ncbi:hypothetical protein HBI38_006440 [Parastagonospora nodorum]|nr:hypothetical protein HBI73_005790 [Parastagonospora nodorum]KAH5280505.1 hypothetical protein HBI72_020970 [Parastagonospora nodorum]KAH6332721.1 hypothetical protein HBI38_006440 [Parastagonospora nodorum]
MHLPTARNSSSSHLGWPSISVGEAVRESIALLYAHSGITSAPQHASSPGRYAPTSASSQGGLRPRVRFS